jgi:GAF domain-containing protein
MTDQQEWLNRLAQQPGDGTSPAAHICGLCVEQLGVTGAGIAIVTNEGNRGVVFATDETSARIEELQFSLGEGPCVEAAQTGSPLLIDDLDDTGGIDPSRWPVFRDGAQKAGVRAVFAFPLRVGAITVGVLDLYRDVPGDLDDDQLVAALMAADIAALALLELDVSSSAAFSDDAEARSSYRLEVHQATGIVQVQLDVTPEVAFVMLRARAFALGRSVTDVARDVVSHRLRFIREEDS